MIPKKKGNKAYDTALVLGFKAVLKDSNNFYKY
jgi:hypothetical protein